MADITPVKLTEQTVSAALGQAASAGGDELVWNGERVILFAHNGSAGALTVNIVPEDASASLPGIGPVTLPTRAMSLGAGEIKGISISGVSHLLNENRKIPITYSGVTSLTVWAIRP